MYLFIVEANKTKLNQIKSKPHESKFNRIVPFLTIPSGIEKYIFSNKWPEKAKISQWRDSLTSCFATKGIAVLNCCVVQTCGSFLKTQQSQKTSAHRHEQEYIMSRCDRNIAALINGIMDEHNLSTKPLLICPPLPVFSLQVFLCFFCTLV